MAMNRYELLERLSELLAQPEDTQPIRSHSPPALPMPSVKNLPAEVRPSAVETKASIPTLLLTVPEASAELRISRAQVYILANKQHAIEIVHIGKLARIRRASLEQYVESLRQRPTHDSRLASERELCA